MSSPAFVRLSSLALAATVGLVCLVCLVCAVALGACEKPPPAEQAAAAPGRTVDPAGVWSRSDFGTRAADSKDLRPSGAATASATVDLDALQDLLRAVPKELPTPTDPDGGTRLGTDTGEPTTASPIVIEAPPPRAKKSSVQLGDVDVQKGMASPAIERESRAQLYFPLVSKCRDKDGKLLPADAIQLEFKIDADGYIIPQTIFASAPNPAYSAAAECMRRELSALPFRGPAGARGQDAPVKMTVPSVD